eukprot:3960250-Lingulodinium_polyedra.AAC.1
MARETTRQQEVALGRTRQVAERCELVEIVRRWRVATLADLTDHDLERREDASTTAQRAGRAWRPESNHAV